jgi:hypothetical protein
LGPGPTDQNLASNFLVERIGGALLEMLKLQTIGKLLEVNRGTDRPYCLSRCKHERFPLEMALVSAQEIRFKK